MSNDAGRKALWDRIEAGQARNAARQIGDYARDAGESTSNFVRAHPLASIAGVAVIGIAIGAMTRPGRTLGRRMAVLATYAAEFGIAHASGLLDSAAEAAASSKERIGDLGETIGDAASSAKRGIAESTGKGADAARAIARSAARKAGESTRELRSRLKH